MLTITSDQAIREIFLAKGGSEPKTVATCYDVNSDGFVDITDISRIAGVFGKHCPHFVYDYRGNLARLDGGRVGTTYIQGIYEKHDNGSVVKYYDFDGRRIAMSTKPSGGTATVNYLALDGHGNTAYVLNASGGQVSHTRYYPFGLVWTQEYFNGAGSVPTDKLFDGYQQDLALSGLYYAGARFYSADLGRFLSQDPVQSSNFANPQSLNPYSYVMNNPMTHTDPTGMCLVDMPRDAGGGARGCGLDPVDKRYLVPPSQESRPTQVSVFDYLYHSGSSQYEAACTAFGGTYCYPAEQDKHGSDFYQAPSVLSSDVSSSQVLVDNGCSIAILFSRNVACTADQLPPPGGGLHLGGVIDALTSDCAVGIYSAIGLVGASVATGGSAAYFVGVGGLVTSSATGLAVSGTATAVYALSPPASETVTNIGGFAYGAVSGLKTC